MIVARYALACALLLCHAGLAGAEDAEEAEVSAKLDVPAAQRLVAEAVGHGATPRSFAYEPGSGRPLMGFSGWGDGEGTFGYFAVNQWTGDVWALWGCRKVSTPTSRKTRAAIKRRFTHEELKQYAELSALKPSCVFDPSD